jgi:hypothetical protein
VSASPILVRNFLPTILFTWLPKTIFLKTAVFFQPLQQYSIVGFLEGVDPRS